MKIFSTYLFLTILVCLGCGNPGKQLNGNFTEQGELDENGLRIGVWKKTNKNGIVISEATYKKGIKNGHAFSYYDDGTPYIKCIYSNDTLVGEYTMYYKNGKTNFQQTWNSYGRSEGLFQIWYETGELKGTGYYHNGKMISKWVNYFPDGRTKEIKEYDSLGRRNGHWVALLNNGDTSKFELYKKDSLLFSLKSP